MIIREAGLNEALQAFMAAIVDYAELAARLGADLCETLGIEPSALGERDRPWRLGNFIALPGDWICRFGVDTCVFGHRCSGAVVPVSTLFADDFAVLIPHLLDEFIRWSPNHQRVAGVLARSHFSMTAIMEILEDRGCVRKLDAEDRWPVAYRIAATDDPQVRDQAEGSVQPG